MKAGTHKDLYFPFGIHRDKLVCDIPTKYLKWIIGEKWFREKFDELAEQVKIELDFREKFPKEEED